MHRYISSLTELPQRAEKWLYAGFCRVFSALKAMHALNLVHMDVKLDNVFVDMNSTWDLGDFGSAREIGARVWTFTHKLNPYIIPSYATVIPAMDFVLLCVMIAAELKKDEWQMLTGHHDHVREHLIIQKLNTIQDADFKKEVVELFEDNMRILKNHLLNL